MKIVQFINRNAKRLIAALVVIGVLAFGLLIVTSFYPKTIIVGTVDEKLGSGMDRNTNQGRIVIKEKSGEKTTLSNVDNWLSGKYQKYEKFQKDITVGKTYSFETVGVDASFLGLHPNIVEYQIED